MSRLFKRLEPPNNLHQVLYGNASLNSRRPLTKKKHEFQIIIEQDEAGYFVAECPALKACYA